MVVLCTAQYCTVLYCTVLYCTVLYCTVLYCTVLYCTDLLGELLDAVAHLQLVPLLGQLARSLPLVVLQSAQVMLLLEL